MMRTLFLTFVLFCLLATPFTTTALPPPFRQTIPKQYALQDILSTKASVFRALLQHSERLYQRFSPLLVIIQCVREESAATPQNIPAFSFEGIMVWKDDDSAYLATAGNPSSVCVAKKNFFAWHDNRGMFFSVASPVTFVASHSTKSFSLFKMPHKQTKEIEPKTRVLTMGAADFSANAPTREEDIVYVVTGNYAQPGLVEFVRNDAFLVDGFPPDSINSGAPVLNSEGQFLGLVIRHIFQPDGKRPKTIVIQISRDDVTRLLRIGTHVP